MSIPRISVLLPAFNAAATLEVALRSVARQTWRDWECVVVDDGSIDATAEIAGTAERRDARFRVVRIPHGGLVGALNHGITQCRAPYIARMDADDLMHRERLAAQLAALEATDLAAVGCHVRLFPRSHLQTGWRRYESWLRSIHTASDVRRELFVESPLVHPTLLVRRDLLARFPYRECGWPEDYDLLLRLDAAGHRLGVVPRRLLGWRDSPARLSRTHPSCEIDVFARCKASFLADGFLATHERYTLWGYGATGRALHRALQAYGKTMAYLIEMHPGRIGNRIHGARVVHPNDLPQLEPLPLLASVAGAPRRAEIRDFLQAMGRRELVDFRCVA